ncbi:MAG: putative porin, partial [Acidobacteria bacterium]|nr:putative porin [Acidobacteriota bacterium]
MSKFVRMTGAMLCIAALLSSPATLNAGDKTAARATANAADKSAAKPADKPADAAAREEVLNAIEQLRTLLEKQNRELEAQRATLREQQGKMAALEAQLAQQQQATSSNGTHAAPSSDAKAADLAILEGQLEAVADSQAQLGKKVGTLETTTANNQRNTESKLRGLGAFTFSGDVRLRAESFFGSGLVTGAEPPDRHRQRVRLRFNANAKFNDEFSGGLTLTSGDLTNPISANQTLTGFFERKPVGIDRAFFTYTPKWFKPLSVTGGKFAYTWYRTELTWDNDINPEGLSETFGWDFKNPVLKRFAVIGLQMPYNEVTAGGDSAMFGGQIQMNWALGSRAKLGTYLAYYDHERVNSVAQALASGTLSGNAISNANGTIAGNRVYASKFGLLDSITRLDVTTNSSRFPLMMLFDFVQNTRACANLAAFGATPPACNPRDRQAYWTEVQLGKTQEQRDMRFGYVF